MQAGRTSFKFLHRITELVAVLAVALALRLLAAGVLQWFIQKNVPNRLCVFPDTEYYWQLAKTIRSGSAYEIVEWGSISHRALRTPGYPLFLAACQAIFGEWSLGVRLVQAVLGTLSVGLVYLLTQRLVQCSGACPTTGCPSRTAPLLAAGLAAIDPYYVAISELLLSEALFVPLMLATLWGLAVLCGAGDDLNRAREPTARQRDLIAIAVGAANGAAVLTKPSFGLFLPGALLCWVLVCAFSRHHRVLKESVRGMVLCAVSVVLVMSPWWIRNARTYGRFVSTSIWLGASLYDGLNRGATGASNMDFRNALEFRSLDELNQDAILTRSALNFVRENPARVLELALIKLGRYWSAWPNADEYRNLVLIVTSAVIVVPIYFLIIAGAWDRHRDARALVLLAGPVLYFCAIHLVFVSSIRYRIPGEMAATALAGIGFASIVRRVRFITYRR
jgi:4-amino-4-deoxy-L-arabinose transferase-like glycosyltransferase